MNFALNTIYPYTKSWKIFLSVGSNSSADPHFTGQTAVAGIGPQTTNLAYNGDLSAYSSTAIADVVDLPMITEANGNIGALGGGMANPGLTCATPYEPCTYVPASSDGTCGSGNGGTDAIYTTIQGGSYWVNKEGENWCLSDGHAKFRLLGQSAGGNYQTDPWTGYDSSGHAGSYWYDGCHAWLFRPDYEFNE